MPRSMTPKDIATVKAALERIAKRPDLPNPERDADWKNCTKWSSHDAGEALEAFSRIETALSSPPAAPTPDNNGWMPIETAPMDGTRFMYYQDDGFIGTSVWINGSWFSHAVDEHGLTIEDRATHWQPLPPPPALDKGE